MKICMRDLSCLLLEAADEIPADREDLMIINIKENCKLVVELTGEPEQE